MIWHTSIGVIGMLLILVAFTLNQFHQWNEDNIKYDLTNAIGALLLIIYAWLLGSVPFLILNIVWLVVSARDIYLHFSGKTTKKKKGQVGYKRK